MKFNSTNSMRLRNIFISTFVKGVEQARNQTWDAICQEYLEEHNELEDKELIAFRVEGNAYPQSVVESVKKSVLHRKSGELHEDLVEGFKRMRKRYEDEWEITLRSFKNMISVVFREAKTIEEVGQIIPDHIMNMVSDEVDFVSLNTAKGISRERADQIIDQYALAFNIENFITVSKLI